MIPISIFYLFNVFAYDYIEIFEADDFYLPTGIYITVHGLGFVNLTADLHFAHRGQARNGHSRISDTDTLLHRFGPPEDRNPGKRYKWHRRS